jgi:hypothetical protein
VALVAHGLQGVADPGLEGPIAPWISTRRVGSKSVTSNSSMLLLGAERTWWHMVPSPTGPGEVFWRRARTIGYDHTTGRLGCLASADGILRRDTS